MASQAVASQLCWPDEGALQGVGEEGAGTTRATYKIHGKSFVIRLTTVLKAQLHSEYSVPSTARPKCNEDQEDSKCLRMCALI